MPLRTFVTADVYRFARVIWPLEVSPLPGYSVTPPNGRVRHPTVHGSKLPNSLRIIAKTEILALPVPLPTATASS